MQKRCLCECAGVSRAGFHPIESRQHRMKEKHERVGSGSERHGIKPPLFSALPVKHPQRNRENNTHAARSRHAVGDTFQIRMLGGLTPVLGPGQVTQSHKGE